MAKRKLSFWCIVNKDTREPVVLGKQNTYQSEGRAWGVIRSSQVYSLARWEGNRRIRPSDEEVDAHARANFDVVELVPKTNA